jgi:hypothetical protein
VEDVASQSVPAWARWFVRLFLAAFVVCALAGIEAWPLTGWRLFSHLRTERQTAWEPDAVGVDGREARLAFGSLPAAFHGFPLLMKTFAGLPRSEQASVCAAWLSAARTMKPGTTAIRIYRVSFDLLPRRDGRPAGPSTRQLAYRCTDSGVGPARGPG